MDECIKCIALLLKKSTVTVGGEIKLRTLKLPPKSGIYSLTGQPLYFLIL